MTDGPSSTTVLVNLTWLVPGVVGGSEESITDALRAIHRDPPEHVLLHLAVLEPFLDAHPDLAEAFECTVLRLDGRNKVLRVLAEQTWLAARTRAVGAQVVHHAGGVVPLVHPGRAVLTVHDLQPLDLPENFSFAKRAYIRAMVGRSARAAHTVCVPSRFARERVIDLLGVEPARVEVVPWFPRPVVQAADPEGVVPDGPFLLYPAITYPHKNHAVLLDAFERLAAEHPQLRLVLTGGEGPAEDAVAERIGSMASRDRVIRTGRVPQAVLEALYSQASAVVVPSRYEGFGLPVLEAMARGCPVVAARAGSLPEVARADDLVDPDDVTAWVDAVQCVLALSENDRSARAAAGQQLAATFTPAATASGLLTAYGRAASADVT